jgi:CheY-like chemotaxis protein
VLTATEKRQIVAALKAWAKTAPDEPTIGFLGNGDLLRPSEIVTAVESGTDDGESILEILEHGVRREGIEKVVSRLISAATKHNPPPGTSSPRVLLGEDDSIDPKWNLKLLETLGCDVTRVADGNAALNAWRRGQFDIVLMDCQTPRIDWCQAAAEIRRLERGTHRRALILALMPDVEWAGERGRCFSAGIDDILNRPITLDNLRKAFFRSRRSLGELKID